MAMKRRKTEDIYGEIKELKSDAGWLYAGLPKFRSLFGRDSIISSLQLLDFDDSIAIETLKILSETQGIVNDRKTFEEPGKIIHEIHEQSEDLNFRQKEVEWLARGRNYFSIDSTPLYVILLVEEMKRRKELIPIFKESLLGAMRWIIDYGLIGKYISYNKPPDGSGPQSMSWRDGIGDVLNRVTSPVSVIGVQSYTYEALSEGSRFMGGTDPEQNLTYRIKGILSALKGHIYDDFTDEDGDFPGIAIGGDGVLSKSITSEPGHLIFSGILDREHEKIIIDRLFEEDMLTQYGIRTMSNKDPYFDQKAYQRGSIWPNDNWIIAYGLMKRGYKNEFTDIRNRMLECSEKMGGLQEFIGVDRDGNIINPDRMRIRPCYPQAWATGSEYYFRTH
ncbi:MAG: hypothetical protein M1496_00560 [Candidatus Thermoplasmatota archaeon]|jgi:glycogen debranching enzyme|nr:hypothetical protein [Candidatus Thermoplasmatota archaeon]